MTTRDAFEKGTDTFNAHDIDGFAEVLADDVVFKAPGGMLLLCQARHRRGGAGGDRRGARGRCGGEWRSGWWRGE